VSVDAPGVGTTGKNSQKSARSALDYTKGL